MKRILRNSLLLVLVTCLFGTAWAVPHGTLEFVNRTGFAEPNQSIDVRLRLTLAEDSTSLRTDSQGQIISGISAADLAAAGIAQLQSAVVNVLFRCSGTFTASCTIGPPYDFDFGRPWDDTISNIANLDLGPGESIEFLFGRFNPTNNLPVPSGTYVFHNASVFLSLAGLDANGHRVDIFSRGIQDYVVADTCPDMQDSCAFIRTVRAEVPEPMGLCIAMLAALLISRRCHAINDGRG